MGLPQEKFLIFFKPKRCGADIITVSHSLLEKVEIISKNLFDYSVETAEMFINDSKKANFKF